MKNELGIEICCKNCEYCIAQGTGCRLMEMPNDGIFNTRHCVFSISPEAYEARIKELQKQQFTEKELHIIKNMIIILLSHDPQRYELHLTPLLKNLDRIINER